MIECFHVYVLWWSHAWTLWWLPTPVLKCFANSMLTYIDIHMFDIHTHVHTLRWWNVYWLEGKNDCIVGRFNTQMSWWLCLNAEMIGRLQVCVFGCFNAYMHICSHDRMVVCSQALLITYSHWLCFDDKMLSCQLSLMISCFYAHFLWCSHVSMIVCSHVYMLWWSHATYLYTIFLIWLDALMVTCSYIQMLWWLASTFTCLISTHECTHDHREMSIVLEA